MMAGHYAAAFAAAGARPRVPLWALFVAAQLVDIVWALLVLFGVERLRLVPGFIGRVPLDLQYMPFSHSLLPATLAWAVVAWLVARRVWSAVPAAGVVIGLTVASHWFLDVLVHAPDMPVLMDSHKIGLGIWAWPLPAYLLEAGCLVAGLLWYLRSTRAVTPAGRWSMSAFVALLLATQAAFLLMPPPEQVVEAVVSSLVFFLVLPAVVWRLARARTPR